MEDSFTPIPGAIEVRESLPRPNWDVIAAWVGSHVEPATLEDVWSGIARDWLGRLAQSLPPGYEIYDSSDFLLLAADPTLAKRILNWCEDARQIILETLDGVACDKGFGKYVVLLFADKDSYYDYVSDFYPDSGEFALSGGMFLNVGYGHFALCPAWGDGYVRTIAHEMTHTLLRHLPLPLWLDEGVTLFMEDVVLDESHFRVDAESARRHREYWNDETIHTFWSGESFYTLGEVSALSYYLAQILFRNLLSDHPKCVKDILNNAHYADAGNAAFVNACNQSLADRVTQFLGPGAWAPRTDIGGAAED